MRRERPELVGIDDLFDHTQAAAPDYHFVPYGVVAVDAGVVDNGQSRLG
ncbi:hypothetical protein ACX80N_12560 [Arthrobacter sp. MDT2-16]